MEERDLVANSIRIAVQADRICLLRETARPDAACLPVSVKSGRSLWTTVRDITKSLPNPSVTACHDAR